MAAPLDSLEAEPTSSSSTALVTLCLMAPGSAAPFLPP